MKLLIYLSILIIICIIESISLATKDDEIKNDKVECFYKDSNGKNRTLKFYPALNLGQTFIDYIERGYQCSKKVTCLETSELKIEQCSDVGKTYNISCKNLEEYKFSITGGFPKCCLECDINDGGKEKIDESLKLDNKDEKENDLRTSKESLKADKKKPLTLNEAAKEEI